MDCIFCKIIKGEIPNYTVYEDDNVLAFLDIHPSCHGHTVVIPKKHFAEISEMGENDWADLMSGVKKVARRIQEVLNPDGMNIAVNDGPDAGQAVPHAHWHIFPRWSGDGGGSAHSIIKAGEGENVETTALLFKK